MMNMGKVKTREGRREGGAYVGACVFVFEPRGRWVWLEALPRDNWRKVHLLFVHIFGILVSIRDLK